MKQSDLINKDTQTVLDNSDKIYRTMLGLIIIAIACCMVLGIHYCTVIAENKALHSKCDSLKVSNKSLTDNLNMGSEIRKFNELNK